MTIVYDDKDLVSAYKQKKRIWYIYLAVAVVYVALCVTCLVLYIGTPFEAPEQNIYKWTVWVASCLFVIFSFVYLTSKYQRIRKYYKLVSYLSVGLKSVNNSIFLRYESPEIKDSVDYYVLVVSEWSKKKSEYMDRKIYCDKEKPLPEFKCGDKLCYLTQGNVLIGYEVTGHDDTFVDGQNKPSARK